MFINIRPAGLLLLCLIIASTATAEPNAPTPDWSSLPQEGLLAGEGGVGAGSFSIRAVWGGPSAPITGSATMPDSKTCVVRVISRSTERVQLNIAVKQFNTERKIIGTNPFLMRLDPYKTNERTVKTRNGTIGCGLFLTGWKLLD